MKKIIMYLIWAILTVFSFNAMSQEESSFSIQQEVMRPQTTVSVPHPVPISPSSTNIVPVKDVKNLNDYKAENLFVLISSLFVLFMTLPGIGLFYSGLVRKKNVLSLLVQTSFVFVIITMLWFAGGYSLALIDGNNHFIGSWSKAFFMNINDTSAIKKGNILLSEYIYILYHLGFAIITCSLIIGAVAERVKFKAIMIFSSLWLFCIYCPLAFMLWSGHGYAEEHGVLDWAGGLVVHVNAGVTGLILAIVANKRKDFGHSIQPHNLALVFIGTSFLVVGWAGFNGGSSFDSIFVGAKAILVSFISCATGGIVWALIEKYTRGSISIVGLSSGFLVGLVAITPAAGYIDIASAPMFGLLATPICVMALKFIKNKVKIDDALDVFAVHGVGGIVGSILTGAFAPTANFMNQLYATLLTVIGVAAVSYVLITFVLLFCNGSIRYQNDEEEIGLDLVEHGEELE